jgi:hypothetical protein
MNIFLPPAPITNQIIRVDMDVLPEWLEEHHMEIVEFDGNFNSKVIEVRGSSPTTANKKAAQ